MIFGIGEDSKSNNPEVQRQEDIRKKIREAEELRQQEEQKRAEAEQRMAEEQEHQKEKQRELDEAQAELDKRKSENASGGSWF